MTCVNNKLLEKYSGCFIKLQFVNVQELQPCFDGISNLEKAIWRDSVFISIFRIKSAFNPLWATDPCVTRAVCICFQVCPESVLDERPLLERGKLAGLFLVCHHIPCRHLMKTSGAQTMSMLLSSNCFQLPLRLNRINLPFSRYLLC